MDFRVYVIVEIPTLELKYELLVPVDRRIHDLIRIIKEYTLELKDDLSEINLYSKSSGNIYDKNLIIKDSDIKMGSRLVLI